MLHYKRLILQNEPLIKTSSMRFESKHREIKAILNAIASHKNILLSVGIRKQLSLTHFMLSKYRNLNVAYGAEVQNDSVVHIYFPLANTRKTLNNVTINDVTYKAGTVIVASITENEPIF